MNRELVTEILNDSNLFQIADIYSPLPEGDSSDSNQTYYKNLFGSAEKGEMIIPILGLQGTGKSTLMNALLMDDIVLPVNAQETNCIAVEIRAGETKELKMVVHFQDENKKSIICSSPHELEQYVSDEFNHANEKNVSYAEIFSSHPLLENNVVFVDLPGVGSLTEQNVRVTMNYLKKQVGAIFLLKTYQPITRSEKLFLKTALAGMGEFWFVQNRWADEREDEVTESVTHNKSILKSLIQDPNAEPSIFVINAKHAFETKFQTDPTQVEDTGMKPFVDNLFEFQKNWRSAIFASSSNSLSLFIQKLHAVISERISDQNIGIEELQADLSKKELDYKNMIERNSKKIDSILLDIDKFQQESSEICKEQAKESNNNLRARMREVIQQGIVDGSHLNRSFQESQQFYNEEALLNISDMIVDFSDKCKTRIEDLEINSPELGNSTIGEFNKQEKMKFEKLFTPAGGAAGSIAGYFAAGALTAALKGGTLGSFAGPIGTVVGVAIGLLGVIIGSLVFKNVQKSRINVTMNDLEAPLREARKTLEEHMRISIESHSKSLRDSIDNFSNEEVISLTNLFEDAKERIKSRLDSTNEDINTFHLHLNYISSIKGKL